ncbi:hypothetical protein ACOMHN_021088 [Nucella lapillus]
MVTEDPGYDHDYAVTPQGKLLDVVVARWTSGNCRRTVYGDGGTHGRPRCSPFLPEELKWCLKTPRAVLCMSSHVGQLQY